MWQHTHKAEQECEQKKGKRSIRAARGGSNINNNSGSSSNSKGPSIIVVAKRNVSVTNAQAEIQQQSKCRPKRRWKRAGARGLGVQLMAHRQRATAANDVDAPMTAATKWADRAAKERTKRTMSSRRRRWTAESTRAWLFYG